MVNKMMFFLILEFTKGIVKNAVCKLFYLIFAITLCADVILSSILFIYLNLFYFFLSFG